MTITKKELKALTKTIEKQLLKALKAKGFTAKGKAKPKKMDMNLAKKLGYKPLKDGEKLTKTHLRARIKVIQGRLDRGKFKGILIGKAQRRISYYKFKIAS